MAVLEAAEEDKQVYHLFGNKTSQEPTWSKEGMAQIAVAPAERMWNVAQVDEENTKSFVHQDYGGRKKIKKPEVKHVM